MSVTRLGRTERVPLASAGFILTRFTVSVDAATYVRFAWGTSLVLSRSLVLAGLLVVLRVSMVAFAPSRSDAVRRH